VNSVGADQGVRTAMKPSVQQLMIVSDAINIRNRPITDVLSHNRRTNRNVSRHIRLWVASLAQPRAQRGGPSPTVLPVLSFPFPFPTVAALKSRYITAGGVSPGKLLENYVRFGAFWRHFCTALSTSALPLWRT